MKLAFATLLALFAASSALAVSSVSAAAADTAPAAAANISPLKLSLTDCEKKAVNTSPRLKGAQADAAAAHERASANLSLLFPRLALEATGRYVTVVPSLTAIPGQKPIPFGDNWNYSVGPTVYWTLWDSGALWKAWRSAQALEGSKTADEAATRKQLLLAVRSGYFRVQLATEQLKLVNDSLKVVEAQYRDIQNRLAAGTSSQIDSISAHKEVLNLRLQVSQNQTELAVALRDLMTLTGGSQEFDPALLPGSLELDPIDVVLERWLPKASRTATVGSHPQIRALEGLADSSERAAESAWAQHWPRVQLSARSSLDYPNGPILEQVQQNTVGVTASWSLFEAGRVNREVGEKRAQAESAAMRAEQAKLDLERDRRKTLDQLESLKAQADIHRSTVAETDRLASLVYSSYRAGRSSVLEVESANLRALEAKMQLARNKVQTLVQLAVLDSLVANSQEGN